MSERHFHDWPDQPRSVRGVIGAFRNGLHYRFPLCCVIAYCWWLYWDGVPGWRLHRRYGKHAVDTCQYQHVPCWFHTRRNPPIWDDHPELYGVIEVSAWDGRCWRSDANKNASEEMVGA